MAIKGLCRCLPLLLTVFAAAGPGCAGVRPCPIPESQVESARREADAAERELAPVVAQRDSVQEVIAVLEARRDSLAARSPGDREAAPEEGP